jgi:hypothetical protein
MCDENVSHNFIPDMAAGMERLSEYRTYNSQFCKRIFDYLSIMFTAQVLGPPTHLWIELTQNLRSSVEDAPR